jgi:hypothetical protein
MSNRGEAWKKFVQTFFLAEQPNGYFVLNDIFRFLKEETAESEEEREDEEASADEKPIRFSCSRICSSSRPSSGTCSGTRRGLPCSTGG